MHLEVIPIASMTSRVDSTMASRIDSESCNWLAQAYTPNASTKYFSSLPLADDLNKNKNISLFGNEGDLRQFAEILILGGSDQTQMLYDDLKAANLGTEMAFALNNKENTPLPILVELLPSKPVKEELKELFIADEEEPQRGPLTPRISEAHHEIPIQVTIRPNVHSIM